MDNSSLPPNFSFGAPPQPRFYSSYSAHLNGDSHIIAAFVQIDGKKTDFNGEFSLSLTQNSLKHSLFTLVCNADTFETPKQFPLSQAKHTAGKKISIFFKHYKQTAFLFTGLITSVRLSKKQQNNKIVIKGYSPDILLENGLHCRSFENKTLEEIVQEVCQPYPQDRITLKLNPKYKDRIGYITQYQETDYCFLQRLAKRFGEWLYWNGETLVFGGYGGKTVELFEEKDMENLQIGLHLKPQQVSCISYNYLQNEIIQPYDHSQERFINHFQEYTAEVSKDTFTHTPTAYIPAENARELTEIIQREKQKRRNLVSCKAKTSTPSLRVGDIIKVHAYTPQSEVFKNGKSPLESYVITKLTHYFDLTRGYYNKLKAIPREQLIPPYYSPAVQEAATQRAVVVTNNDPEGVGRVKVRFVWQAETEQSPFIRIVTPYAGAGKGFYFPPETGEEVQIGFENNDIDKPFVQGALYNGKEKSGYYDADNRLKALHTNKGHVLEFDEREESMGVTIKDKNGNSIHIDTKDNTINFTALKDITLNAEGKISLNAGTNIEVTAQKEIIQHSTEKTYISSGETIKIDAGEQLGLFSQQKLISYSEGQTEIGTRGVMHLHGTQSKITALSTIDYKAPCMNMQAEPEEFKYTQDKKIISAKWVNEEGKEKIKTIEEGEKVNLLVQTLNYKEGEEIKFTIKEKDDKEIQKDKKELVLSGLVQADGTALLQEEMEIDPIERKEQKTAQEIKQERQEEEKRRKKEQEYKEWEQKQWEKYQAKKRRKLF